jgi:GT2 family glycosyltransferase
LFYGGHLSIRRQSLFEVGLFDENYDGNWGAEDQDLGYRLHQANKKIVLCRKAMVLHLPDQSDSRGKAKQGHENSKYFNQKFQTFESQLFFESYAKDTSRQITHREVLDFHELVINAQQP